MPSAQTGSLLKQQPCLVGFQGEQSKICRQLLLTESVSQLFGVGRSLLGGGRAQHCNDQRTLMTSMTGGLRFD